MSAPSDGSPPDGLSTTWSIIVRAQGSGREAQQALGNLIERYQGPVLCMIRTLRHPPGQSPEDLKQEFFLKLLGRDDLNKLDPARGRFRSWLYVAVRNFLRNVWAHYYSRVSLDRLTASAPFDLKDEGHPERLFMRQFAEATVRCTLERQRVQERDKARFDRLQRFLPGPQLDLCALAGEAEALKMTRNHVAVQICHLRERFRRTLREVVADTLDCDPSSPDGARAIDAELLELCRSLTEAQLTEVVPEVP